MVIFYFRDLIWSFPVVSLLIVSGGYFSYKEKFFAFRPDRLLRDTVGTLFGETQNKRKLLRSVSTALGGTVGVGSIVGVSFCIAVGGAGSIFWMWVSGITGMALKYAEVFLAVRYRRVLPDGSCVGGAPYALTACGHPKAAVLFAVFTVAASFGVGNLTQINALAGCASLVGVPKAVCGAICAVLLVPVLFGGKERIGKVSALIVPPAAVLYVLSMLFVIFSNVAAVPSVLARIFGSAFGIKPVVGGISGTVIAGAVREGFARGVFSTEAGVGSSALAHASYGQSDPVAQGKWGALESFVCTFLISTLTAFALLCDGKSSVISLFSERFGVPGSVFFVVLIAVFAFSSVISWCFYGDVCLSFLGIPHAKTVYRLLFVLTSLFGACFSPRLFWALSDILNGFMMVPNLFLLFLKRKEVLYQ